MENPSKLVALLEQDYDVAVSGGTQDIQATILAGLNWQTSYWVSCTLKWLDQGAPINQEIANCLSLISENETYSQSTRHHAAKVLKRWQRKQNT